MSELRDYAEEDPREAQAAEYGLNYVALDGNIGCIINGAGLAMATMDMIKHAGGSPANFLDVGGGASPERVAAAFRLVLSDSNIQAMLVNIFAGINRCDWVAQGVVQATRETELQIPLVVRLAGTNVEEGRRILKESGLAHHHRGHPRGSRRAGGRRPQVLGGRPQVGRERAAMSILIDEKTKVLVQGFTGDKATFHAREMIAYGTKLVGGVTPGKGGSDPPGPPGLQHGEGGGAGDRRHREHHLRAGGVLRRLHHGGGGRGNPLHRHHHRRHSGAGHDDGEALPVPLSQGASHHAGRAQLRRRHQPGQGDARHHAGAHLHARERRAGHPLRAPSGYEAASQMKDLGIGITTSVGIGGDPINGSSFVDHLKLFEQDPETEAVMIIGEIGGPQEAEAALYAKEHMSKPVIGYVAGLTAPKGRRMGHAGAIISAFGDTAAEKAEMMRSAGLTVAASAGRAGHDGARRLSAQADQRSPR